MKYSDMCAKDRKFLECVNYARQNDYPAYVAFICILLSAAKEEDGTYPALEGCLNGATKEDFKEAIKIIQEAQPEGTAPSGFKTAIEYIRGKWLREEGRA